MRLWSLHPKYLDAKGLVALWRESLLAKHVLEGKTKGYKNHPQLDRFKNLKRPIDTINQYLAGIYIDALRRGYQFDKDKIDWDFHPTKLTVTNGQLAYERKHLLNKLLIRDSKKHKELKTVTVFEPHPLFRIVGGEIEKWEIIVVKEKKKG